MLITKRTGDSNDSNHPDGLIFAAATVKMTKLRNFKVYTKSVCTCIAHFS